MLRFALYLSSAAFVGWEIDMGWGGVGGLGRFVYFFLVSRASMEATVSLWLAINDDEKNQIYSPFFF